MTQKSENTKPTIESYFELMSPEEMIEVIYDLFMEYTSHQTFDEELRRRSQLVNFLTMYLKDYIQYLNTKGGTES